MAFEGLSEKLGGVFKRLKSRGRLSEADVKEAMREVKMALLEADVSYKVVKEFIANVANAEHMPEKTQKNVEFFGTYLVNDKHVISLQNDRGSSYQAYISVQNELVAAYNELRDELAEQKFGTTYAELNDDQQKAIREIYPQRISEAEPKKYGEKKK